MKKILELIIVVLFFTFVWGEVKYEPPDEWMLETVTGELISITEAVDDDMDEANDHYIVLQINKGGITRNLMSFDKSLLSRLSVGSSIEAQIAQTNNVSELWTLKENNILVVSYEDTDDIRWNMEKRQVMLFFLALAICIFSIIFGKGLQLQLTRGSD